MFKTTIIKGLACLLFTFAAFAQAEEAAAPVAETNLESDLGYFYGYSFGNMLRDGGSEVVDVERLMAGLQDALARRMPQLSEAQQRAVIEEVRSRQEAIAAQRQAEAQARQQAEVAGGIANLTAANEFLAQNATRAEIRSTPSGLQYEVIEDTPGDTASANSVVVAHYKGTLIDGTVFDQSGESPVEFELQRVIPGWTEGLQLMSPGDKYRLYIHPDLAYGAGAVGQIPPNSLLIFDIELIDLK